MCVCAPCVFWQRVGLNNDRDSSVWVSSISLTSISSFHFPRHQEAHLIQCCTCTSYWLVMIRACVEGIFYSLLCIVWWTVSLITGVSVETMHQGSTDTHVPVFIVQLRIQTWCWSNEYISLMGETSIYFTFLVYTQAVGCSDSLWGCKLFGVHIQSPSRPSWTQDVMKFTLRIP